MIRARLAPRPESVRTVAPYASIARVYDQLIGDAGLEPIWNGFRHSCRRYGIRFGSVADIGCGTGRFLERLSRSGTRLWGVDRSPAMLAVARRRLAGRSVTLLRQDMTRLALPEPVDLLTANFNVVNYLQDLPQFRQLVDRLYKSTTFQGCIIFDMFIKISWTAEMPAVRQLIGLPGVRAIWDVRPLMTGEGAMVSMHTCFERPGGSWNCATERHAQRWWPCDAIESMLVATGFHVLGVHRLGDHRPAGSADRWVQIVARRCARD